MWGDMVNPMVLLGENYVMVLQHFNPLGKTEVGVRPLMEFIRHADENGQHVDITLEAVHSLNIISTESAKNIGHSDEERHTD